MGIEKHPQRDGLTIFGDKFKTGKVIVYRKSITVDLLGHSIDPQQKLLSLKIKDILEECTYIKSAKLNQKSHDLEKKLARKANGFAYYHFNVGDDIYQLDNETREGGFEVPYCIRKVGKRRTPDGVEGTLHQYPHHQESFLLPQT